MRSPHPSARIWSLFRGLNTVQSCLQPPLLSKGFVLEIATTMGTVNGRGTQEQERRGGSSDCPGPACRSTGSCPLDDFLHHYTQFCNKGLAFT